MELLSLIIAGKILLELLKVNEKLLEGKGVINLGTSTALLAAKTRSLLAVNHAMGGKREERRERERGERATALRRQQQTARRYGAAAMKYNCTRATLQ